MRYASPLLAFLAGLSLAVPTWAQNVETRVQTRVETQVDTIIKSGSGQTGVDISQDEVSFNAVGAGKTEKEATIEAYYYQFKILCDESLENCVVILQIIFRLFDLRRWISRKIKI